MFLNENQIYYTWKCGENSIFVKLFVSAWKELEFTFVWQFTFVTSRGELEFFFQYMRKVLRVDEEKRKAIHVFSMNVTSEKKDWKFAGKLNFSNFQAYLHSSDWIAKFMKKLKLIWSEVESVVCWCENTSIRGRFESLNNPGVIYWLVCNEHNFQFCGFESFITTGSQSERESREWMNRSDRMDET